MGADGSKNIKNLERGGGKYTLGEGSVHKYAFATAQGKKKTMEDRIFISKSLPSIRNNPEITSVSLFAVFDGHGGEITCDFCKTNLLNLIQSSVHYDPFVNMLQTDIDSIDEIVEELLQDVILRIDVQLRENYGDKCNGDGSTALIALLTKEKAFISNLGDSRGCLLSLNGKEFDYIQTEDHKPYLKEECKRIESFGKRVFDGRIDGGISMSRAVGDFNYKNNGKLPFEEILSTKIDLHAWDIKEANYLCLASDGLWGGKLEKEIFSKTVMEMHRKGFHVNEICDELTGMSLKVGDNVAVILIKLRGFGNERKFNFFGMKKPTSVKRYFDEIEKEKKGVDAGRMEGGMFYFD